MKLAKAIEELDLEYCKRKIPYDEDYYDALRLGIEAAKEVKRLRSYKAFHVVKLLPGETKE